MKKIRLIFSLFCLIFIVPGVFAQVTTDTWHLTLGPGRWATKSFSVRDDNKTCSPILTSDMVGLITNLPDPLNFTDGAKTIEPYIVLPSDASGSYAGRIEYCDALVIIDITINETVEEPKETGCNIARDIYIDIYGSKTPGGTLMFYIRNTSYYAVGATVTVSSATSGNPSQVIDCSTGFCEYVVAPNEIGPLVVKVEIPGCGFKPIQVDLTGVKPTTTESKNLVLESPSTVTVDENFVIMVRANGDLESGVTIRVVGIHSDDRFFSTSDSFGSATFKVRETGEYRIYGEKEGYNVTQLTINAELPLCPYECCIDEEGYQDKVCEPNYDCKERECRRKIKKDVIITCGTPKKGERMSCRMTDYQTGEVVDTDTPGKLIYNNITVLVDWVAGSTTIIAPDSPFELRSDETPDHKEGLYTYNYPVDVWFWLKFIGLIILILFIIIVLIIFLLRRGRGRRAGYPSSETELETIVPV